MFDLRQPLSSGTIKIIVSAWMTAVMIIAGHGRMTAQDQKPSHDLTENSLEELGKIEVRSVYSASKYLQKVTEAPSSVNIVTADEIRKYGHRTLADVLRGVRGFYVSYDRNYSYLGVRGFARPGDYNTRILLMVDGHRINDNLFDVALLGTELPVDVDLIDRIEIIRGPSSSLYGTSAFFAVINVITKQGQDLKGLVVSTEGAGLRTYKGRFSYGRRFKNGLEAFFSGSFYGSHGQRRLYFKEYDSPLTNNGLAEDVDDDRSKTFFTNFTYRDLVVRGVYGVREKGIPTGSFDSVFNDSYNRTIDRRGYLDLQYHRFFDSRLELMARLSYDMFHYDGTYLSNLSDGGEPQSFRDKDIGRGGWLSSELQLTRGLLRRHKVTLGTEYRDNLKQNLRNYDEGTYSQFVDDRRRSKNAGFYFQDGIAIRENVTLSVGVRHDYYTTFGGTTRPRLGLIYRPAQKTSLKFLYGEAFRAPNNYELFYTTEGGNKANPNLRPESIKTGEVALEQYLGEHLRLSASGYLYRINGLITQQVDPIDGRLVFNNVEKIESRGLGFEAETKLANGVEGRVGYTLQDTQDRQTKETLTNSPKHLGKLNLIMPLVRRKVFAGLELQYTSRRKTLAGGAADAFWLSNLTLFSQKLINGLDLSFSIYNLFDRRYGDPGAEEHRQEVIEQNGRNLRLKVTYRFNFRATSGP